MTSESNSPPANDVPPAGDTPPVITPPPVSSTQQTSSGRSLIALLLSLCLGLFVVDAFVSLADDSLVLFGKFHGLSAIRTLVSFFTVLMTILVYGLMGVTPMVPKRLFLPVTLFTPFALLAVIPFTIYFFSQAQWLNWSVSLIQVLVSLAILFLVQGGFAWRWPLVSETWLRPRAFSWLNVVVFMFANVFVLVPVTLFYLLFCASLAVDHFTGGFLTLHSKGLMVQVSKYVRADGKTIQLYPMAHVGDASFYQKVSQSFPTNSMILMEGVSDDQHLLTNHITYKRMARSLGVTEQKEEFKPTRGEVVRADVDVGEFTPSTIDLLNRIMLIHAQGLNAQNAQQLVQYPVTPQVEAALFDDLLAKRNQHLLAEIRSRLAQTDYIIVPWGAAHIPTIAAEIQKAGFHLTETQQYVVIRFGGDKNKNKVVP